MLVGYVRCTSSASEGDSHAQATQESMLRSAGCEVVFVDQSPAHPGQLQPELDRAVASLRPGDGLLVTALDRMAASFRDLIGRIHQVQCKGASFRSLEGSTGPNNNNNSSSQLLGALLSFDPQLARDRAQSEPKAAARSTQPQQPDRPRLLDVQAVKLAAARLQDGEPVPHIARSLGISAKSLRQAFRAEGLPRYRA